MKRFFAVMLTAFVVPALFACDGNVYHENNTANETEPPVASPMPEIPSIEVTPPPVDPIEIVVWESGGTQAEFMREAGERFNGVYPDIYVKVEEVEPASAVESVTSKTGVWPDLFAAPLSMLSGLVDGEYVWYTIDESYIRGLVQSASSGALEYKGSMYGYPIAAETYALFYNKKLVTEPPKTWDELIKLCEKSGGEGFVMDVGNGYHAALFTSAKGNRLFGENGNDPQTPNVDTDEAVMGMSVLSKLGKASGLKSESLTADANVKRFIDGKAAMYISGASSVKTFADAGVDFGVAPLPALPGDDTPSASLASVYAMFVPANSENKVVADEFCRFLLTPEMQKLRYELTGTPPATDVEVDPPGDGFVKQLANAYPVPPALSGRADAIGAAASQIWDGGDVKAALTACREKLTD